MDIGGHWEPQRKGGSGKGKKTKNHIFYENGRNDGTPGELQIVLGHSVSEEAKYQEPDMTREMTQTWGHRAVREA